MSLLRRIPFHPLLLGIYPVFALIANNIREIIFVEVIRTFLVVAFIAVIFLLLFGFLMKDWHRAALASSLVLLVLLSYGHLYSFIHSPGVLGVARGRHRYILPVIIVLTILGCWWIFKRLKDPKSITGIINLVSLVILILPLTQILSFQFRALSGAHDNPQQKPQVAVLSSELESLHPPAPDSQPDIYYIILDAYGRDDVLEEYFELDNTPFLNQLRKSGFYVADCSQVNYSLTALSVTSTLNMSYLDQFGMDLSNADLETLIPFARKSAVRKALEGFGYKIIGFESGYFITEWPDADLYLSRTTRIPQLMNGMNAFETMFLDTTVGKVLTDFQSYLPAEVSVFLNNAYTEHREQILYVLSLLEEMPFIDGPKFVMAHIIAPHGPFVFGPHGEFVTQTETFTLKEDVFLTDYPDYIAGYHDELLYLNSRIEQLVEDIKANSKTPPIIIIQSDHGPHPGVTSDQARMSILNAYYLPDGGDELLYPSISPVNSFRVIFNYYFGAGFELLPDVALVSGYGDPYEFVVVPENRLGCVSE